MAELTRRNVCRALGGGILLISTEPGLNAAEGDSRVSARIHLKEDGLITLLTGKVELGQGARTLLTQAAAEELRVPPSRVRVVMGDTALVPDDGGTWASMTTPVTVPEVRRAAAAARLFLIAEAAERFGVVRESLEAEDGRVRYGNRDFTYAELARGARLNEPAPISAALTPPAQWRVCGTSLQRVQAAAIVTGAQQYSCDRTIPGMWHGAVVRSPYYRPKLQSLDGSPAERMGAQVVRDGEFAGVVAADARTARNASRAVEARWTGEELPATEKLYSHFKQNAEAPKMQMDARYPPLLVRGDLEAGFRSAERRHEASYRVAPIAHVALEPRSAIAAWDGGKLTVWFANQAPFAVRQELASTFGIPAGDVRVISSDAGGAFGGKQRAEVAIEAARLAKAAGKPIKLQWSREEEFMWSYLRPAGLVEVKSALDARGRMVAWDFRNYNSGAPALAIPYDVPNYMCGFWRSPSPFRQGSYRSLAAVANTFARESHIDELAALAHADPVDFRLRHLANARLQAVIERGAETFGWLRKRAGEDGAGMCANLEKGGHLASFVAIALQDGQVRVTRAVVVLDCGAILNPHNLRNQVEGAFMMGLGGALFEEIRWNGREVLNARLSHYRVPRFSDLPQLETILVDRRNEPSAGAGESPITIVAPAISAAIFNATGRRLRALPLERELAASPG